MLAGVLWEVYTSQLVPHAEDHLLHPSIPNIINGQGQDPEGKDEMQVDERNEDNQDLKPRLRITNPLLLELNARSKGAFQASNEGLLTGEISKERFLEVFLPRGRKEGGWGREKGKGKMGDDGNDDDDEQHLDRLGLQGEEREKARGFLELMRSGSGKVKTNAVTDGIGSTSGPSNPTPIMKARPIITNHLDFLIPLRPSNPFSSSASYGLNSKPILPKPTIPKLPLFARYILLAAFCASYNSPRTDLRIFGRGPIGSLKRKIDQKGQITYEASPSGGGKKKGGGIKKVRLGKVGKVPQSLLGPKAFTLDRMLAIFMALLVEHGWEDAMALRAEEDEEFDEEEDEDDEMMMVAKGGLLFEDDVATLTAKRRDRMRRREERRKADWEDEVEEISRSVGVFGLVSSLMASRLPKAE